MIRNLAEFVVILSLACLAIGGGVAALYGVFCERIEQRELAVKEEAIREVCPEGAAADVDHPVAGEPFTAEAVYAARDSAGRTVAYIAQGEAQGYSSVVKVMVSASAEDFAVIRVVVLSQQETPGLGATVAETRSTWTLWQKLFGSGEAEEWVNTFLDQFTGKQAQEFPQIHSITAATITSNATKVAVKQALERIRDAAGKKGTGASANE
jgi:RnfABCDGE-type electron transport complex G subunit